MLPPYSATNLECLAMVWAIQKFRHYLVGNIFEIFTDHYSLKRLHTMKAVSVLNCIGGMEGVYLRCQAQTRKVPEASGP